MLKRKFTLHLDALMVIALLFIASVAFNLIQLHQVRSLTQENLDLQMQALVDKFNLESQKAALDKLGQKPSPANNGAAANSH
ncbi:hypothetical protein [Gallaecimonas pentaromativorans]|uniref:hypothetical protein n=1 Tax=Gallaecimonas pentaromativorans TaxID=584787 RepID=UPI003A8FE6EB